MKACLCVWRPLVSYLLNVLTLVTSTNQAPRVEESITDHLRDSMPNLDEYKEVQSRCVQNMITVLGSMVDIIGGIYMAT
jgi:hypothetical protein